VRAEMNRGVQIGEDLGARRAVNADPRLYGLRIADCGSRIEDSRSKIEDRVLCSILDPRSSPLSVDAADFVDLDLHYALEFGVGETVPFAGRAHAEDHVGAVTVLDDVANDPALFVCDHSAGVIQNRNDRNVQTRFWRVVHLLSGVWYGTGSGSDLAPVEYALSTGARSLPLPVLRLFHKTQKKKLSDP